MEKEIPHVDVNDEKSSDNHLFKLFFAYKTVNGFLNTGEQVCDHRKSMIKAEIFDWNTYGNTTTTELKLVAACSIQYARSHKRIKTPKKWLAHKLDSKPVVVHISMQLKYSLFFILFFVSVDFSSFFCFESPICLYTVHCRVFGYVFVFLYLYVYAIRAQFRWLLYTFYKTCTLVHL